jgi:hypothetical protein
MTPSYEGSHAPPQSYPVYSAARSLPSLRNARTAHKLLPHLLAAILRLRDDALGLEVLLVYRGVAVGFIGP